MKIAVFSQHIPSQLAHSINTVKHAEAFLENGNDVKIFSILRYKEQKNLKNNNLKKFYGLSHDIEFVFIKDLLFFLKDIYILNLFFIILRKILLKMNIYFFYFAEKKMANLISKGEFDLVYSRCPILSFFLLKKGVNVVVESHLRYKNKKIELQSLVKYSRKNNFLLLSTISDI